MNMDECSGSSNNPMKVLIEEFIATSNGSAIHPHIATCICNGTNTIVELVEAMEALLLSESPATRAQGTQLLADVLHGLPQDFLSADQLLFMTSFFVDRMKDHHAVLPGVVHATNALLQQSHIGVSSVQKLALSLLSEVHCQSQLLSVRRDVYTALRLCCTRHPQAVDEVMVEFVLGLVSAADGEKDPRNLLLVFSLVPLVATSAKILHVVEDLFEVVAAYFPIDFVPPSHDPCGVTTADLEQGLRQCLACTPRWAEYLLPLLLEKMESDLSAAKVAAYTTLASCCECYTPADIGPHLLLLWQCIRRDVVAEPGSEAGQAAAGALRAVVAAMYRGVDREERADNMVHDAISECSMHLSVPGSRLSQPASALLTAMVGGAQQAAAIICDKLLPALCTDALEKCKANSTDATNTVGLIGMLLLEARHSDHTAGKASGGVVEQHSTQCLETLHSCLSSPHSAVVAAAVVAAHGAFYGEHAPHWHLLADHITRVLLEDLACDEAVRERALEVLSCPCSYSPTLLSQHLLPALLNIATTTTTNNNNNTSSNVAASSTISSTDTTTSNSSSTTTTTTDTITDTTSTITASTTTLLAVTVAVTRGRGAVTLVCEQLWPAVVQWQDRRYVDAVADIIERNSGVPAVVEYLTSSWHGVHTVATLLTRVALGTVGHDTDTATTEVLRALARLCRVVVALSSTSSSDAVLLAAALLSPEGVASSPVLAEQCPAAIDCWPVTEDNCSLSQNLVYVVSGLLCSARDVTALGSGAVAAVLHWATQPAVAPQCRTVAAVVVASLVNKTPQGEQLTATLSSLHASLCLLLTGTREQREAAVAVWGWVAKALEMRAAPEAAGWMAKLQSLLADPALGPAAARCYAVLLQDLPDALSQETCCNVRLLYKQRLFQCTIEGLVQQYSSAKARSGPRHCALLAIMALLVHLPPSLLHGHAEQFVVAVVEGVRCNHNAAVVESAVSTLKQILLAKPTPPCLVPHVGSLVPALLALANCSRYHDEELRRKMLQGKADVAPVNAESAEELRTNKLCSKNCDDVEENIESSESINHTDDLSMKTNDLQIKLEHSHKTNDAIDSASDDSRNQTVLPIVHQSLAVREISLLCLELLVDMPLIYLLPYRDEIIRGVKPALNDHKRLVRSAAAGVRSAWMLLGTL